MPTPSLLIVPARFKTGKLYSQLPTSGAGDFTVTRNTAARRVNSAGLLESVASGIPRLDYYTSGGVTGCPALLVEPAAINLALHSRDLTNAVWSGTNVTTAKNAVGADGVASGATTLTATAASGTVLQSSSHGQFPRVFSAYVRRVTGTGTIQMTVNGGTNWDTVTISSAYTQVASAIRSVASGTVGFRMAVSGDVIEVDFTQYEATNVTSPIATTAASGSRSADVISVSGAVSGSIGQTEGTIYMEVDVRNLARETYLIRIDEGAAANVLSLRKLDTNQIRTTITAPTTSGTLNISSAAFTAGIVKVAFAYKSGEIALSVNGATALTANGTFSFGASLNRITLGSNAIASSEFNDRIRAVALYTTRLTNAELATLTTP